MLADLLEFKSLIMFARQSLLFFCVAVCYMNHLSGEDVPAHTANYSTPIVADSSLLVNPSSSFESSTVTLTPASASPSTPSSAASSPLVVASSSSFPNTYKWNVTEDGQVCIVLQSAIRISFRYLNQETDETVNAFVDVPSNAIVDGGCGSTTQTISLSFYDSFNLTLIFTRNDTEYFMSSAVFYYKLQHGRQPFPAAKDFSNTSVYMIEDGKFKTMVGTSAVCTSQTTVFEDLDKSSSTGILQIGLYDTKLEAFRSNATDSEFSVMGNRCSNDDISLLVPIIVGACLAGLIVFVLVAYFIGRQRSKRGYSNVLSV